MNKTKTPSHRHKMIADVIQREIALILQREWSMPVNGLLTVAYVEMNSDLQYAKIFISYLGEDADFQILLKALNKDKGLLRKYLAGRVSSLRYIPELKFFQDDVSTRAAHLSQLLRSADDS